MCFLFLDGRSSPLRPPSKTPAIDTCRRRSRLGGPADPQDAAMNPARLGRQTLVGGPPGLACLGCGFHLGLAPLIGLSKPSGGCLPAEAPDNIFPSAPNALASLTPLDRPKPSGTCERGVLGDGIARTKTLARGRKKQKPRPPDIWFQILCILRRLQVSSSPQNIGRASAPMERGGNN